MSGTLIAFGVTVGVPGESVLHTPSQVRLGSLNQRMNVIGHTAVCEYDSATAFYFLSKSVGEAFVVTVIMKQCSAAITAGDDVVIGTGELDARRTRHDDNQPFASGIRKPIRIRNA
jgi:hypothetical protein